VIVSDDDSRGNYYALLCSIKTRVELNSYGGDIMKRLIASVVLAIALLTSGMMATQYSLVGTAYADDGGGAD
jgi:hypothetical protein